MSDLPAAGSAICNPPPSAWNRAVDENRRITANIAQSGLKDRLRAKCLEQASKYMNSIGLSAPSLNRESPLLIAGHQPYFFHPGVFFKYALLARSAQDGFCPLFISVDTEPCEGFPAKMPSFNGRYSRSDLLMSPSDVGVFYQNAPADKNSIEFFKQTAIKRLSSLPEEPFRYGVEFLRNELKQPLPEKMRDAMVVLRRRYAGDWQKEVLELPLSHLCDTPEFYEFAFHLLLRAGDVRKTFNSVLADYRKEHRIRSNANPFPDLLVNGDGRVETLFWISSGEKRAPLFVGPVNGGIKFSSGGKLVEVATADRLMQACRSRNVNIWPRAVSLSLMLRLFLGDLFIHGIGGAKYDRITDKLIKPFYGIDSPRIVTASCTPEIPGLEKPANRLEELEQTARRMEFHPEFFLTDKNKTPETAESIKIKKMLVEEIKKGGADKKSIGLEIKKINAKLDKALLPLKAELAKKIETARAERNRHEILADRELPYFLYSPQVLERFVKDMKAGQLCGLSQTSL